MPVQKARCEGPAAHLPWVSYSSSDRPPPAPHSLTETIECLQANIDQLQSQVEELKASGRGQRDQGVCDRKSPPSLCLKELYDLRQ